MVMALRYGIVVLALGCGLAGQAQAGRALVEARMKTIIFPKLDFRAITFVDSVEYLRLTAKELDPEGKGINIILKAKGGANPTLSMMLGKTSLHKALKLVTEIAGYRWRFIGNTLMLEPRPPPPTKR